MSIILKTENLGLRVPQKVLDAYRELAQQQGCTVSQLTRRLITEELKRNGKSISVTVNIV